LKQPAKHKSIGIATLKTLGAQYTMYVDMLRQVSSLHAEFDAELSQALSLVHQKKLKEQNVDASQPIESGVALHEGVDNSTPSADKENATENQNDSDLDDKPDKKPQWLKKLFKKIAIHCHPDKVLPANFDVVEKHRRMSSYDTARKALDKSDKPLLISVGLLYDEVAEVGVSQSKQILSTGVKGIEAELTAKQKSLVWSWGMSEDNLDVKAKVLIHAAAQFYNISMSTEEALKIIKEFFEIYEPARSRKVGEHPGARLKTLRGRKE